MKFYKQVLIVQSETDLITAYNMYYAALKTKKIFIETTLLANLTSLAGGSAPNPVATKKVYTYTPLYLENEDFEFKKKYVAPFYIHNANNKMKKEKYVLNINESMLQDIQLLDKEGSLYDTCVIFSKTKEYLEKNEELENFIKELKEMNMDYYEIYSQGQVNFDTLKKIDLKVKPKNIIPIDFNKEDKFINPFDNFKILQNGENIKI